MLSFAIAPAFGSAGNVLLLAFGFGFVIFWHELGHFLAAKWADVKVEQFAVGFGQALFSWRKGLGFRWGSSQVEYQAKIRSHLEQKAVQPPVQTAASADEGATGAATFGDLPTDDAPRLAGDPTDAQLDEAGREAGISETEYRLNWIPLGGYVKMLGQDDMRPGAQVADPRSYTSKPVGKRMVIVSAGVVMNVILAAIGFMVYFSIGPKVPKATVGEVVPGAPAQLAVRADEPTKVDPIRPGDTILTVDGRWQYDFDKIRLNTPLLIPGEAVPVEVRRAGTDHVDKLLVTPRKATPESEFPQLGIAQAHALLGPDPELASQLAQVLAKEKDADLQAAELSLFTVGDTITAVDGRPVTADQSYVLTNALQAAGGKPVPVTVRAADGTVRTVPVPPHFADRFGDGPVDFAGLQMLPQVLEVSADSSLRGHVRPGDVVVDVADTDASGGHRPMPTRDQLEQFVRQAADGGSKLTVTILHPGGTARATLGPVTVDKAHPGLGLQVGTYEAEPVVAHPPAGSAAEAAGVPGGAVLRTVDGKPVHSWFDVYTVLCQVPAGRPVPLTATVGSSTDRPFTLRPLTVGEVDAIRQNRIDSAYVMAVLQPATTVRKAGNALEAAKWGVGETRDAIVQVYLTMRAMFRGSISPKEFSGPLGILAVGYKFAEAGAVRLLWFLSIISANLAVMNFLPIPVVDGGLFTFLVIEKLKGSPISQRTQSIAQVAGLVLLLGVFLFATWQDLFRIPQLFH